MIPPTEATPMPKLRKRFRAVYEQYQELNDCPFQVIRKIVRPTPLYDAETLPVYEIVIVGKRITAWPEEVEYGWTVR